MPDASRAPQRWPRYASAITAVFGLSCTPEFDTSRQNPQSGTLGAEVFRIGCERVHAGESPRDVSFLGGRQPCVEGLQRGATAPGAGPKVNALGHFRAELVAGLDQAMPEPLHDRLDGLLIDLLPLYGADGTGQRDAMGRPVILTPDGGTALGEDLLPRTTRSVSTLFGAMATDVPLLNALSRASFRQGYRHPAAAFGLLRPVLGYARTDAVLGDTLRIVRAAREGAPEGAGHATFNTLLETLRAEAVAAGPSADTRTGTTLDATLDLVFRGESSLGTGRPNLIVRRDARGMAFVNSVNGQLPAPFADEDRDGLADVRSGQFVRGATPVDAPTPFATRFSREVPRDPQGRAVDANGAPLYRTVDLDQTVLGTLARQLPPLLGGPGHRDVAAMDLLHGASLFFGARRDATRAYTGSDAVRYRQFAADNAPLVDLIHAVGVLLSHRDAGQYLALMRQLTTAEREAVLARLLGAMLAIDAAADRYPAVRMDARSAIWDDVMDVVRRIAEEPGLLEDLLDATARLREPISAQGAWEPRCAGTVPADNLSRAFSAYAANRDRVEPTWSGNLNAHVDVTLSQRVDPARADTTNLANRGAADDNRSVLARLFHLVDDLNGAEICNRQGGTVRIFPRAYGVPLGPISVPGIPRYDRCRLLRVPDAAAFFVRAVAGGNRAVLAVDLGGFLDTLTDAARRVGINIDGTLDGLIERQSGIAGLTSLPSPYAIARLVFQPTPSEFITDITDAPVVRNSEGYVQASATAADRQRFEVARAHPGTIFVWESYCFYDSIRPLAVAFARHDRIGNRLDPALSPGADPQSVAPAIVDTSRGSRLFSDLLSAFHRHWPSAQAGTYQSRTRCERCREGVNYSLAENARQYEPIVSQALQTELLQALSGATAEIRAIQLANGRRGTDAMASLIRALVDPNARGIDAMPGFTTAVSNREGRSATLWSDGSTPARATLFTLFADAFNAMDPLLAADNARRASWESARSAMVDQVIAINGTGTAARFQNRGTPGLTRQLVGWAADRVEAHRAAGDVAPWARGLSGRFAETVRGPLFATGLDLMLTFREDADARARMAELLTWLLNEQGGTAREASPFATTTASVGDLLQVMRADGEVDPILHAVAPAFVPRTGTTAMGLTFLDRSRALDQTRVLVEVLGNMVRRPTAGDGPEPLTALADAIADTQRERPGERTPLSRQDVFVLLRTLTEFFSDDRRGLEQFYSIVNQRRLPR